MAARTLTKNKKKKTNKGTSKALAGPAESTIKEETGFTLVKSQNWRRQTAARAKTSVKMTPSAPVSGEPTPMTYAAKARLPKPPPVADCVVSCCMRRTAIGREGEEAGLLEGACFVYLDQPGTGCKVIPESGTQAI